MERNEKENFIKSLIGNGFFNAVAVMILGILAVAYILIKWLMWTYEGEIILELKVLKSIRTNNFNDIYIVDKIKRIWREAPIHLSKEKVNTYGVYHKYSSNYKGDYTLSIAVEDANNDTEVKLTIPEDTKYKIFQVDPKDELGVINVWKEIWELEDKGNLKRAYTYDFEKYLPNGKVEIYIALA